MRGDVHTFVYGESLGLSLELLFDASYPSYASSSFDKQSGVISCGLWECFETFLENIESFVFIWGNIYGLESYLGILTLLVGSTCKGSSISTGRTAFFSFLSWVKFLISFRLCATRAYFSISNWMCSSLRVASFLLNIFLLAKRIKPNILSDLLIKSYAFCFICS